MLPTRLSYPRPSSAISASMEERSWVVLSESNLFDWPGPDLRRIGDRNDSSVAYGFLPPRLFAELQRRFLALEAAGLSRRVSRTE